MHSVGASARTGHKVAWAENGTNQNFNASAGGNTANNIVPTADVPVQHQKYVK